MKIVRQYLLQLLQTWVTWLFIILDAVGLILFCVAYFIPDFVLPQWTFWLFVGITLIGFMGANIKLFADQQSEIKQLLEQINELESVESGINNVVHHRIKRQGRGWRRGNVNPMLAALSQLHSDRFAWAWALTN